MGSRSPDCAEDLPVREVEVINLTGEPEGHRTYWWSSHDQFVGRGRGAGLGGDKEGSNNV